MQVHDEFSGFCSQLPVSLTCLGTRGELSLLLSLLQKWPTANWYKSMNITED